MYVFIFGCAGPWLQLGLFSSCRELGLLPSCCGRLLTVLALRVAEHGLAGAQASVMTTRGLSTCGSWALEQRLSCFTARGIILGHSRSGIEPMSPAMTG